MLADSGGEEAEPYAFKTAEATGTMRRHLGGGATHDIVDREFWIFHSLLRANPNERVIAQVRDNLSIFRRWARYLWRQSPRRTTAILVGILLQPLTLSAARGRLLLGLGPRLRRLVSRPHAWE